MAQLEELHRDTSDRNQMERLLKYHDKESMKSAIMKQDAIFRQQVHELHSLYRVQKQLVTNLKSNLQNVEQEDLELTLGTGCMLKRIGNGPYTSDSGIAFSSSSTDDSGGSKLVGMTHLQSHSSSEMKISFDLEERKRKKRFEPHWSLPCLSLKIG